VVVAVLLVVESHLMNDMAEPMDVSITEVRDELVGIEVVLEERATRREVEISDDLVNGDLAGDVASLGGLLVNMIRPMFGNALDGTASVLVERGSRDSVPVQYYLDWRSSSPDRNKRFGLRRKCCSTLIQAELLHSMNHNSPRLEPLPPCRVRFSVLGSW
jgi:hypothetical protein